MDVGYDLRVETSKLSVGRGGNPGGERRNHLDEVVHSAKDDGFSDTRLVVRTSG